MSPKRVYKRPFPRILLAVLGRLIAYGSLYLGFAFFYLSILSFLAAFALIPSRKDSYTALAVALISLFTGAGLAAMGIFFRNFLNRHVTLFTDRPLRSLLASRVNIDQLRTRNLQVYITVTAFRPVLDPYSKNFIDMMHSESPSTAVDRIEREAQQHNEPGLSVFTRAVPEYFDLLQLSRQDFLNCLVQSCALPEIFPARMVRRARYVDGGVADNLPVIPLLQELVDVVLAISLDHRCNLDRIEEKIRQITRNRYYSQLSPEKTWILFRRWLLKDMKEEAPTTAGLDKIILLQPSRSLGNFIMGTLNFSRTKAERDLRLGYEDTIRVFNLKYNWMVGKASSNSKQLQ
jgi:hypothetical protein